METLLRDLLHAFRILRRSPGFTAVSVITLALAIGATTAIFSVVYGVLLRPLPYNDPDRIVALFEVNTKGTWSRLADPNLTTSAIRITLCRLSRNIAPTSRRSQV